MKTTSSNLHRFFLIATAVALLLSLCGTSLLAADKIPVDPNHYILLADIHLPVAKDKTAHGENMAANFEKMSTGVLKLNPRPAGIIICGDLALGAGEAGSYTLLAELYKPLKEAGIPLLVSLGNHDNRANFIAEFPGVKENSDPAVEGKLVTVVETPNANLYLLDSLEKGAAGTLGEKQIDWLKEKLDAASDRPAIIFAHHGPGPLSDTDALLDALSTRKQVESFVFGHSHNWTNRDQADIKLLNLPPVAYKFGAANPLGWVDMRLTDKGVTYKLNTLDPESKRNGETVTKKWDE